MAYHVSADIVTDGTGAAIAYTPSIRGKVNAIIVDNGTLDNTVDLTMTGEESGVAVLALTNVAAKATYAPRQATHDTSGAAALYAAGGTAVRDKIALNDERLKIVVAQGGVAHTGKVTVIME